jgi:hypothetical protein
MDSIQITRATNIVDGDLGTTTSAAFVDLQKMTEGKLKGVKKQNIRRKHEPAVMQQG